MPDYGQPQYPLSEKGRKFLELEQGRFGGQVILSHLNPIFNQLGGIVFGSLEEVLELDGSKAEGIELRPWGYRPGTAAYEEQLRSICSRLNHSFEEAEIKARSRLEKAAETLELPPGNIDILSYLVSSAFYDLRLRTVGAVIALYRPGRDIVSKRYFKDYHPDLAKSDLKGQIIDGSIRHSQN